MSSRATGISSFRQRYCCLSREPQSLCNMLNEIALLASVAENIFAGIDTNPNAMVRDPIDRAAMPSSDLLTLLARDCAFETLLRFQCVAPAIALCQALADVGDSEV